MKNLKIWLGYIVWGLLALPMVTLVLTSYLFAPLIALPVFVRRVRGSDSKWFCSEAIADCLGYRDAWRFDPNTLFVVLRRANDFNNKKVGE